MARGSASRDDGRNRSRYPPIASAGSAAPKWPANANPVPNAAAACPPYRLDPRIHTGGSGTSAGTAVTDANGWPCGNPST